MDEYKSAAELNRQTVSLFPYLDESALLAVAEKLSLKLEAKDLLACRDHFRLRERREPTIGELRFIDALVTLCRRMPNTVALQGFEQMPTDEDRRVVEDLCRMDCALEKSSGSLTPFTLSAIMDMAGRYLARSGIFPHHTNLKCGTAAALAAQHASAVSPSLTLGELSAAPVPKPPYRSLAARTVMLLFPTKDEPFSHTVSRFFSTHRDKGLLPLAAPGDEGILPHLLHIKGGLVFDAAVFAGYRPDEGAASLSTLGKDTVLFLAPAHILPQLFSQGDTLAACGRLTENRRLSIQHGPELLLSLPLDFLCSMHSIRAVRLTPQAHRETVGTPTVVADAARLLGGVCATGGAVVSILSLLGALAEKGADFQRVTLTAILELPPITADSTSLAAALPPLFDYHRVVAELALPTCNHRQILREGLEAPRLTVFAAAEQGDPRRGGFFAAWQNAATARDFAAMRRLLRG